MKRLGFEKYAQQKPMDGLIAQNYQDFFKKEIDYKNKEIKILDYGCGDGKYFIFFRKYFPSENIFGIEVSRTRVKRCVQKGWKNVLFLKNKEKLPFPNNYFNFINFDQVIEHIREDKINFYLLELNRILKAKGKIILITPNYPIKRIYDLLDIILKKDISRISDDPTHFVHYNFDKLNHLLKKYFKKVRLYATGGSFYNLFKNNYFSHKIIGVIQK